MLKAFFGSCAGWFLSKFPFMFCRVPLGCTRCSSNGQVVFGRTRVEASRMPLSPTPGLRLAECMSEIQYRHHYMTYSNSTAHNRPKGVPLVCPHRSCLCIQWALDTVQCLSPSSHHHPHIGSRHSRCPSCSAPGTRAARHALLPALALSVMLCSRHSHPHQQHDALRRRGHPPAHRRAGGGDGAGCAASRCVCGVPLAP